MGTSEPGNSVYFEIGVWYDASAGAIHLTARDAEGFHVAVRRDPKHNSGHPYLFDKLAQALRDAGASAPQEIAPDA